MTDNSQPPLPPQPCDPVPPQPGDPTAQQNDAPASQPGDAPAPPRPAVIPPPPISDAPTTRPGVAPIPQATQAPGAQPQQPLPTQPYGSAPAYGSAQPHGSAPSYGSPQPSRVTQPHGSTQPYGGQGANPYAQQPTGGFVAGQTPPPLAPAGPVVLELRKMIPGWLTPVLALAAVLVVGAVMAATLLGVMSSFGSVFNTLNPVQALLLGFGAVLGGGFAIESSSSFASTVSVASIGTIVTLGVAIYFVTRFTMRSERGQAGPFVGVLVRSVIEAFPVAILAMIFSIFGRINISFVTLAPPLVGVLFTVWLTVAFAMIMARMRGRGISRWGTAGAIVREPIWYSVLLVSVLSVLVLIALIVMNIDKPLNALAWLPYGANAAAYAAALGQFGQLVGAQSLFDTDTAMAWDIAGPWAILLILTTLLTMLYASVFIGTRRGRLVAFSPARIWQLPVGMFVLTLLYTYTLGSIRMSGDGSDSWIGLSFVTSLIVAGFALVVSILAEVMPGIIYGISPGMLNFLAGRRAAHVWVAGMPTFVAANASSFVPMPPTAQTPYGGAAGAAPAAFTSAPGQPGQPGQPGPVYGMGDPSPLAPAAPPRQPMSKKTKRRVIGSFVTVGVLALLIVGAFVTLSIVNSTRGPEAAVKEYVDLIAAGKAEEASKLVKPGKGEEELQLLTDAVMSADGVTRIEVGKITSKVDGDKGQATVKMTIDGKKFSAILDVKQGDKEFGLLNTWVVDEPLVYEVELGSDIMNTVEFAGQEVSFSSDDYQTGTFLVYPGSYPVTATSNSPYLNGDELTLVVDKDTDATLSSEISDEVEVIVLEKVKEFVAECAEVPTNTDSGCPDEVQDRDLAKLELTEELTEFESFQQNTWGGDLSGEFYTGEATITVTPNATSTNKSPKPKEVTFSLYGSWEIDGNDEIQVEVVYTL